MGKAEENVNWKINVTILVIFMLQNDDNNLSHTTVIFV